MRWPIPLPFWNWTNQTKCCCRASIYWHLCYKKHKSLFPLHSWWIDLWFHLSFTELYTGVLLLILAMAAHSARTAMKTAQNKNAFVSQSDPIPHDELHLRILLSAPWGAFANSSDSLDSWKTWFFYWISLYIDWLHLQGFVLLTFLMLIFLASA